MVLVGVSFCSAFRTKLVFFVIVKVTTEFVVHHDFPVVTTAVTFVYDAYIPGWRHVSGDVISPVGIAEVNLLTW